MISNSVSITRMLEEALQRLASCSKNTQAFDLAAEARALVVCALDGAPITEEASILIKKEVAEYANQAV